MSQKSPFTGVIPPVCLDDASESACVEIGKHACKHRVARGLVSAR